MTASILGVRNLGWRAGGTPVLEQVNFAVSPGEFVGVMGRNGAGKSTLLDILAGLKTASKGAVTLKDRPLGDWAPVERARLLAHLPQSLRADLSMRGEALVLMGRYPYASGWFESAEDRGIALEAMTRCGCLEFRHRRLGTLSGGERQRVLLAACLAQQPRVLLLDEPATFLDVDQQLQCFTVLRAEAERGAACLAVTHDVNLALTFCTRLLVLAGRTVACDMPAATALDAPEWLGHFSTRLRVDGGLGMRPWVPVPVTVPAERSAAWWIGLSALSFAAAAVMLPFFGPTTLDLSHVWSRQEPDWSILTNLRLSRTLLGLFAGGALALSGSLFQSMLRDALATPYTLGVSTGASLGAVVAIGLEWHMTAGIAGVWAGAFGGAAIVLYVVMGAATQDRQLSVSGLLLAGIAINSVCGALILLVHGLSGMSQSFAISRWLIGSLDAVEFPTLAMYIGVVILLAVVIIRQARHWNLLSVGEAWAATRGAGVNRSLLVGYIAGSVLAAATVALTGPIGFVGLVVPHLLRARLGGDDRIVMPCAFLLGGMLLAACDALGRVVIAPAEIPAGAITAFIGGPYLIWMIRKGSMR